MEQINTIELADPSAYPDENRIEQVLGASYGAYRDLLGLFERLGLTHEWRYYKDGKAWLCKVRKAKRTIAWMSAWKGFMKATIYFPEKHVEGLYGLDIAESEKEKIRNARNVGKSKPCMFEIRTPAILDAVEKTIAYKLLSK